MSIDSNNSIGQPPMVQAVRPTKVTLFLRNWIPWQIVRFAVINFKMTLMILKSHDKKIEPSS